MRFPLCLYSVCPVSAQFYPNYYYTRTGSGMDASIQTNATSNVDMRETEFLTCGNYGFMGKHCRSNPQNHANATILYIPNERMNVL
jgi:hypothetical protein